MEIKKRFAIAAAMAEEYDDFVDFAMDGMAFLGFDITWMQADIAEFMQTGPRLRMVMAQRGEAKSTLAALYAVWRIIQHTACRVLIVSGGEKQASEVAYLIVRLITTWDMLEYLRPDRQAGDRTSTEAFDVHWSLKGVEKSPSVACVGITSNLPGKRADLLIPDDIETNKNGLTMAQRELLLHLSKEFTSICTHGDILYLGTPQSEDSIYNTLASRGYEIRIWPGRFPTPEEREKYGHRLAPSIVERITANPSLQRGGGIDGKRGAPADPDRYNEAALVEKELDKGPADFQLQYMLDTSLADDERRELKLHDLVVANFDPDAVPEIIVWQATPKYLVALPPEFSVQGCKLYHPVPVDCAYVKIKDRMMYIDPAGNGGDELAFAVSGTLGPYVHVFDVGGLKGGFEGDNPSKLCSVIRELGVKTVKVETNMGHGLFEINLRAELEKRATGYTDRVTGEVFPPDPFFKDVGVASEYSTGQKERRIIDSLVSPLQRHRVVIHQRVLDSDRKYNLQHSMEKRAQYSMFAQLNNITKDRNSLPHDDRLEAMAGAVRHWKGVMASDENAAAEHRKIAEQQEFLRNPMGYADYSSTPRQSGARRVVSARRARK